MSSNHLPSMHFMVINRSKAFRLALVSLIDAPDGHVFLTIRIVNDGVHLGMERTFVARIWLRECSLRSAP